MNLERHRQLLAALKSGFERDGISTTILQTHISSIVLAGAYAYKIKKPVAFDFLDYTVLEKRLFYCNEEIRLNIRYAPQLYIDVVKIAGSFDKPEIVSMDSGDAQAFEYAVRMHRFDNEMLLGAIAKKNALQVEHIEALARHVAEFHQRAVPCEKTLPFGSAEVVIKPIMANFTHTRHLETHDLERANEIEQWNCIMHSVLTPLLNKRKERGYIRECHGDMHLGNIVLFDEKPILFDGIEFNDTFKWIDVISDLAFLLMDLQHHGYNTYQTILLNSYVEITGDYEGVVLLPFYLCHRSMVRFKINHLMGDEAEALRYLEQAHGYTQRQKPILFITYGFSGSGKSVMAKQLSNAIGAVVVRSDSERSRLFEHFRGGKYSEEATEQLYGYLLELAVTLTGACFHTLIDATFLKRKYRTMFIEQAKRQGLKIMILHALCDQELLFKRIVSRSQRHTDPSEATVDVLTQQLKEYKPLNAEEERLSFMIDTTDYKSMQESVALLKNRISYK